MGKRNWRIRGYKQFTTFFDVTLPPGCLSEKKIMELIRCLAAKGGLYYEEIVGAYVKRKTKYANGLLLVTKNGPYPEFSCGNDPYFTAIIVDEQGKRIKYPSLPRVYPPQ